MFNSIRIFVTTSCLALTLLGSFTFAAEKPLFTKEDVFSFSPRAKPEFVTALVENQQLLRDAGITTKMQLAHFFSQIATETGGMRRLDEDLNYKKKTLLKTFSRARVSEEKASELAGHPHETANWLYGNMLGNKGQDTNDGWDYRGSGFIQLTGRGNYRDRGREADLLLEESPDLARQPVQGLKAATAYWKARKISNVADSNDVKIVRVKVNGKAAHGLPAAKLWFNQASKVLGTGGNAHESAILMEAASANELTSATASALEELGFFTKGRESSVGQEQAVSEGLRLYQKDRGLQETGKLDEDTLYAITDPQEWKKDITEDNAVPTEVPTPMMGNPEETVSYNVASKSEAAAIVATETGAQVSSNSEHGTGVRDRDTNLSPQELSSFANSKPTYSPYELEKGFRGSTKESFIPFSIIGKDDRTVVANTTVFPARAIVEIIFTSKNNDLNVCTGTLISPNMVLTAGHCLHSGTISGTWYTNFVVYPGRNTGSQPFGSCTISELYTLSGWVNAESSFDARQYDLGAIKLNCDVGHRTGWFSVRAINDNDINLPTTVQGYPVDRPPAGRQFKSNDKIRALQSLNVFYQNDTFGGMSGSPVYTEGENAIFAIHTSGLHDVEPWSSNNGATRITQDRLQTIMGWTKK